MNGFLAEIWARNGKIVSDYSAPVKPAIKRPVLLVEESVIVRFPLSWSFKKFLDVKYHEKFVHLGPFLNIQGPFRIDRVRAISSELRGVPWIVDRAIPKLLTLFTSLVADLWKP